MLRWVLLVLAASPLLACMCLPGGQGACSSAFGDAVVFLAVVTRDSGEQWGHRPARVKVEEPIFNSPPRQTEIEIDNSPGTSCYYRLELGQRYVIISHPDQRNPGKIAITACSNSFRLAGNEHIFDALINKVQGGPARLLGKVRRSKTRYSNEGAVSGALVTARSESSHYEARADAEGRYEIRGILPGRYQLEVSRAGFVPDSEFNHRWSGRLVLDPKTKKIGPDATEPRGTVTIHEKNCQTWDLAMWPHGRISGTVRDAAGQPAGGITVQAFSLDPEGNREYRPVRIGRTDDSGRYRIEPLPAGDYHVAVNGDQRVDADPYPATFHSLRPKGPPSKLRLEESAELPGVDLELPLRLESTKLNIQVLNTDGSPAPISTLALYSPSEKQVWFSNKVTFNNGVAEVPVYLGEQYVVEATFHDLNPEQRRRYDVLRGRATILVQHPSPTVTITLSPRRFGEP